ncbi:gliding motility-associated C-terminal domain-containing protein [Crocinitomix catalasitica]|nr:gliding motility-associated C-terminal domain-containing protein [Crocinitomix catalasitica]
MKKILTVCLAQSLILSTFANDNTPPIPYTIQSYYSDTDGIPDAVDLDDDNDGIPDTVEGPGDTDGDGIPDRVDLDSDNDGIADVIEAGGLDADGDGEIDGFTDANLDGLDDATASSPLPNPDTDGDGFADMQDIDSDGDGIVDNIEGPGSSFYIPPLNFDGDADGWDDTYDADNGGTATVLNDIDNDGIPDYLDSDSDNDVEADAIEGWDLNGDGVAETVPSAADSDSDGLDDAYDDDGTGAVNNGGATNGNSLPTDFPDEDLPGIGDLDWRENDRDGDGVNNIQDADDDNDGIPDYVEVCGPGETTFSCTSDPSLDDDGDGTPNYLDSDFCTLNTHGVCEIFDHDRDGVIDIFDADCDNDGISDLYETVGKDANGDAKVDDMYADGTLIYDSDLNGLSDSSTTANPRNLDQLTKPDYQDLDADNDGIYDIIENGGLDVGNNGLVDAINTDSSLIDDGDKNGLSNTAGATSYKDSDNDGLGNHADLDSDNDGIPDIIEGGSPDADMDGMIDAHIDLNLDGADDTKMLTDLVDTDSDLIPDWADLDSDNDLIADVEEAGGMDSNGDGVIDGFSDLDTNGWDDTNPITAPTDTDGDGVYDYLEPDSDNDIIWDIIEGGGMSSDQNFDGVVDGFVDANMDGWSDFDQVSTHNVPDTDSDGTPDYQDLDSDADGVADANEWDSNTDGQAPDDCDDDGIYDWLDVDACFVTIAQGFSPDGDGINDFFIVGGVNYYENGRLTVYNRWGKKVFQAAPYLNNWDGTNQFLGDGSKLLPVGTYFYIFEPQQDDINGNPVEPTRGSVYLQR